MLRKTLITPTLAYGSKCWPFSKKDGNRLRIFARSTLRMIHGPIVDNSMCRTRYSNELYTLYDELDMIKAIKIGRLRWLGHLFRIQKLGPCRKLTVLKAEGTQCIGKRKLG